MVWGCFRGRCIYLGSLSRFGVDPRSVKIMGMGRLVVFFSPSRYSMILRFLSRVLQLGCGLGWKEEIVLMRCKFVVALTPYLLGTRYYLKRCLDRECPLFLVHG